MAKTWIKVFMNIYRERRIGIAFFITSLSLVLKEQRYFLIFAGELFSCTETENIL